MNKEVCENCSNFHRILLGSLFDDPPDGYCIFNQKYTMLNSKACGNFRLKLNKKETSKNTIKIKE